MAVTAFLNGSTEAGADTAEHAAVEDFIEKRMRGISVMLSGCVLDDWLLHSGGGGGAAAAVVLLLVMVMVMVMVVVHACVLRIGAWVDGRVTD